MAKRPIPQQPEIVSRQWSDPREIDQAIAKLDRRIVDLESLNIREALDEGTGLDKVVMSDLRETIREVFGDNSPEHKEHKHIRLWAGPTYIGMGQREIYESKERGKALVVNVVNGLIRRLNEKREELVEGSAPPKQAYLDYLNMHPRIADVATDLFEDGHPWEAVFAASKALVNYVKERSGQHDLDGASLMHTVFSQKKPILCFNDLSNQTELDEQLGMMHLFVGVVLGIRNPGGHAFPEGPEQRAVEYLSLISLLAYRVQEAKKVK